MLFVAEVSTAYQHHQADKNDFSEVKAHFDSVMRS